MVQNSFHTCQTSCYDICTCATSSEYKVSFELIRYFSSLTRMVIFIKIMIILEHQNYNIPLHKPLQPMRLTGMDLRFQMGICKSNKKKNCHFKRTKDVIIEKAISKRSGCLWVRFLTANQLEYESTDLCVFSFCYTHN